jgi:hypothetical protein
MVDALLPQVGSPDGGCKPKIQLNTFQNNRAKLTVSAARPRLSHRSST